MIDFNDVREIALSLPDVTEQDELSFRVGGGQFLWRYPERVDPKKARVPRDDIFMVLVDGLDEKEAFLTLDPDVFFTVPHYDGTAMLCVRLEAVDKERMRELISDSYDVQVALAERRAARKPRPRGFAD